MEQGYKVDDIKAIGITNQRETTVAPGTLGYINENLKLKSRFQANILTSIRWYGIPKQASRSTMP